MPNALAVQAGACDVMPLSRASSRGNVPAFDAKQTATAPACQSKKASGAHRAASQETMMGNIKRYDPFSIEPLGDMLQSMLRNLRIGPDTELPFKVDVAESDSSFTITADLPGVKKEDINVSVDRGTVMISAKLERASEVKEGDRVIRQERYSGSMQRAFTLDGNIDTKKIDASFQDGVLRLVLPKKESSTQQRITVR
jgi:HSP20 family protein